MKTNEWIRGCLKAASAVPACLFLTLLPACSNPTSPDEPVDLTSVTRGITSGPTQVTLQSASIAPGSGIAGCGADLTGCAGRLRMTFQVRSESGGLVDGTRVYLFGSGGLACLWGSVDSFRVAPRETASFDVVFDRADTSQLCRTPVRIINMAAVLEGTIQIATRQEWGLTYDFTP